jgi:hypothetical protein
MGTQFVMSLAAIFPSDVIFECKENLQRGILAWTCLDRCAPRTLDKNEYKVCKMERGIFSQYMYNFCKFSAQSVITVVQVLQDSFASVSVYLPYWPTLF